MCGMPRHRVLVPLRWSDMDAYGHINNVQFLRLLEEARVHVFGRQTPDGGPLTTGLIVGRTEIEYLNQLVFSERPVAVDMWVTAIGGADFDLGYEIRDPDPGDPVAVHTSGGTPNGAGESVPADSLPSDQSVGKVYARAETMQVVYDLATASPRRLTPDERARLESMRDEPVAWRRRRRSRT